MCTFCSSPIPQEGKENSWMSVALLGKFFSNLKLISWKCVGKWCQIMSLKNTPGRVRPGLRLQRGLSIHLCLISVMKIYGSHITEAQGKYTPSRPINKLVPNQTLYPMKFLERSTGDQDKSKVRNKYERGEQHWANASCPHNFSLHLSDQPAGKPLWTQLKFAVAVLLCNIH